MKRSSLNTTTDLVNSKSTSSDVLFCLPQKNKTDDSVLFRNDINDLIWYNDDLLDLFALNMNLDIFNS